MDRGFEAIHGECKDQQGKQRGISNKLTTQRRELKPRIGKLSRPTQELGLLNGKYVCPSKDAY